MKKIVVILVLFGMVFLYAEKPKLYPPKSERGFFYTEVKRHSLENIVFVKTKGLSDGTKLQLCLYIDGHKSYGYKGAAEEFTLYVKDGIASQDINFKYVPEEGIIPQEIKVYFIVRYNSTEIYCEDRAGYEYYLNKEEIDNMVQIEEQSPLYTVYDKYVFKIVDFQLFPLYGYTFELTNGVETITQLYENTPDETLVFDKVTPGNWRLKMSKDQSALKKYLKKHPEDDIPKQLEFERDALPCAWKTGDEMKISGIVGTRNYINWVFVDPYFYENFVHLYGSFFKR